VARDRDVISQLQLAGWKVVIIWECEVTRLSDQPQELDKLIRG
jgi:G:T-mismatch repair DNA endonuclease (very short patch repair protein)